MFEFLPIMHPTEYFLLISNCDLFPVDFCTPNLKHIANILPRNISMNYDVKIVSFLGKMLQKYVDDSITFNVQFPLLIYGFIY